MAFEQTCLDISLPAAGDLSAAQYKFVKINNSGQADVCAAATDTPCGVLQNKPNAAGVAAMVRVLGISKVQGDANLAKGDLVGTSADGQAAAYVNGTDTTKCVVGQVIDDNSTAGGLASVLLFGGYANRGA